jgi:hypothetical protein
MSRKRILWLTTLGLMVGLAAGAAAAELWPETLGGEKAGEPLYFSMTVAKGGRVIARPQLLGESGKNVRLFLSTPQGEPRLALDLQPRASSRFDPSRYSIDVQLDLPDEHGLRKALTVHHGEEVTTTLSDDVELRLLAMRVRSNEFEAWVRDAPVRLESAAEPE